MILLALSAACVSSAAVAQSGDAAAAETLFREGRDAAEGGDHKKACEKFHESHRLDPAPGTMLNIAACEEKLGRLATAWTYYRAVAQKLPPSDDRTEFAKQRAQALEPRLPKLTVRLSPKAPADTRVLRDGVELKAASFDTALPVDPGEHEIEVSAPGREVRRYQLTLAESQLATKIVEPGAPKRGGVSGGVHGDATTSGADNSTLGWVLGGVGVAGIAVGAVTGMMVLDKKSIVDDNCNADKRCNSEGADAAESGRTLGTVSGISFAVGAVALAAGAYFILSSDGQERPTSAVGLGPGNVTFIRTF